MKPGPYVLGTGWWCDNSTLERTYHGTDRIREQAFHHLWYRSVTTFTQPEKILIVDSASPIKPDINRDDRRIELLTLNHNPGHPTNHTGLYSGWTVSALLGLQYASWCDVEFFVYVEQDTLLYGHGIVERCMDAMRKPYMFGASTVPYHPLQQSFFIIHRSGFEPLARNILRMHAKDCHLDPEKKFCIATSPILRHLPLWLFRETRSYTERTRLDRQRIRFHRKLMRMFKYFDPIPFGYGGYKDRPDIDLTTSHFYFQHGRTHEIEAYVKKCEANLD